MKRLIQLTLFILLVTLPASLFAAPPAIWELGQPDAKLLIGIDLKNLRGSTIGQVISSQLKNQVGAKAGPFAMFIPMMEQALNEVDYIFISSPGDRPEMMAMTPNKSAPGKGMDHGMDPGMSKGMDHGMDQGMNKGMDHGMSKGMDHGMNSNDAPNKPPFLVVLQGNFAASPLSFFMSGTPQRYGATDIYSASTNDDTNFALLNDRTLLVGDSKSLRSAIDRQGAGITIPATLLARATELAATHDVWIAAPDLLSSMKSANANLPEPVSQILGLEMGIAMRDGVQFDVNVATKSETAARQMAGMLSSQMQAAMASKMDNMQAAEIASKLKVNSDGNRVRFSLKLTQAELELQMRGGQSAQGVASMPGDPASTTAMMTPKEPEGPKKIKIFGLEEGPREIPYGTK